MVSPDPNDTSKRRRLRPPSVGVLLVIALFVVCGAILLAFQTARSGIRQVEALGGHVSCLPNTVSKFVTDCIDIDGDLLATDNDVYSVALIGSQLTDESLSVLRHFESVDSVYVTKSNVTDAGLDHLAAATSLTVLDLDNSPQISDAGIAKLARLPRLSDLGLKAMQVTGGGIAQLRQLETLFLYRCPNVDDTTLEKIRGLHNLTELCVIDSGVTDAGLRHLAGLPRLDSLCLDGTKVTDEGLKTLIDTCPELTSLSLNELNGITDEGVLRLAALKSLESLSVEGSNISVDAANKLSAVLPDCHIEHD